MERTKKAIELLRKTSLEIEELLLGDLQFRATNVINKLISGISAVTGVYLEDDNKEGKKVEGEVLTHILGVPVKNESTSEVLVSSEELSLIDKKAIDVINSLHDISVKEIHNLIEDAGRVAIITAAIRIGYIHVADAERTVVNKDLILGMKKYLKKGEADKKMLEKIEQESITQDDN